MLKLFSCHLSHFIRMVRVKPIPKLSNEVFHAQFYFHNTLFFELFYAECLVYFFVVCVVIWSSQPSFLAAKIFELCTKS